SQAIDLVLTTGQASASFIQRRLRVGYPRAARMIEMMEEDGLVGPASGSRPRQVLGRRPSSSISQPAE
ncbi:MAG TPA: DNA translocase FtsK, partial [Nitrospiria bacterium]|nr:DNA translocase FtsK [Nitrospiria bacterium]